MDPVLLSRIQFGLTAGFHFIFPPLTLGLSLVILILEIIYYTSDSELYKKISTFMVKIMGLVFVMGVATGIVLEFSFGTNWSNYSRMVGDIFGAPLAAEGIFAFFMESVFLGILIFGRNRVSKRFYLLSVFLVFFASHLSGLWIIIANSWMQTPAGYTIEGGRAVLTNFYEAALNGSTIVRFLHTIIGGWITGTLFTAGVSSWYLLKERDTEAARPLLSLALWIFTATAIIQFVSGHSHSVQVAKTQPEKMAAFEALWQSRAGAPMSVIGIPDTAAKKTRFEIAVPKLLSIAIYFDPNATVQGLNEFQPDELPSVFISYLTYHGMIGLGSFFALLALIALILRFRNRLFDSRWYLWILVLATPLPFISNELGWMSAEIGRQPWAVYRVLKTIDAASVVVPAGQILFTIIMFSVIYLLLFAVFIKILVSIVKKGPDNVTLGYIGE
ncbi:MAG: cytochrome D ubiquinol oxidase subunit I [Spirochaetes bacterium RBG_13_51_14]|nr:MAG: cytochrome D ubiquinol oxidase subunit I [Spirochaetes bacterium RBG_13_51_14]